MFGVSYSQGSVMRAGAAFKVLDETFDFQLKKFPVPGLPEVSDIQLDGISDAFFNPELKAKATIRLSFSNGAMNSILRHYYDGKGKHFDSFAKEVFKDAFDKGFMLNMGKSMHKQFTQKKNVDSTYWVRGETWGVSFIKRVIEGTENLEEESKSFGFSSRTAVSKTKSKKSTSNLSALKQRLAKKKREGAGKGTLKILKAEIERIEKTK